MFALCMGMGLIGAATAPKANTNPPMVAPRR
jgi:hypothetical protein